MAHERDDIPPLLTCAAIASASRLRCLPKLGERNIKQLQRCPDLLEALKNHELGRYLPEAAKGNGASRTSLEMLGIMTKRPTKLQTQDPTPVTVDDVLAIIAIIREISAEDSEGLLV